MGVIEGFFGPSWKEEDRLSYADFLAKYGGAFYIYAPKEDPLLRKAWRSPWSEEYLQKLTHLQKHFSGRGIKFGVGLSPFGLGRNFSTEDESLLSYKLKILSEVGVDILGLFFDDMPSDENLAETQLKAISLIQNSFQKKIIFCPTYYTPDPVLDKVFGNRPERYLEKIADGVDERVSIAWTGPRVISPEIPIEHLIEVSELLKRKPFIWENFFANDGPKNCKFLKLKSFSGRTPEALNEIDGIGLNMMNQPELSKIVFLSALNVINKHMDVNRAFEMSLNELCSRELKSFLMEHKSEFEEIGLDGISAEMKAQYIQEIGSFEDQAAKEISDWLKGRYQVGTECLTN